MNPAPYQPSLQATTLQNNSLFGATSEQTKRALAAVSQSVGASHFYNVGDICGQRPLQTHFTVTLSTWQLGSDASLRYAVNLPQLPHAVWSSLNEILNKD